MRGRKKERGGEEGREKGEKRERKGREKGGEKGGKYKNKGKWWNVVAATSCASDKNEINDDFSVFFHVKQLS